jgi:glycosyltransferase involved in cell wall biosynthesis
VSIVIPSFNEGTHLRETVDSLRAATSGPYEILVVDDGSTDGSTNWLVRGGGDPRVRLFRTGGPLGAARARNLGAGRAGGDVIAFVDAHVLFPRGWLDPLLVALRRPGVGILAPGINVRGMPRAEGFGYRLVNACLDLEWLGRQSAEPYPVPMVGACGQVFRKEIFHAIGGYDPGMVGVGSEDTEICLRSWLLGFEVLVVPQVKVSHLFRSHYPYDVRWTDVVYNKLRTVHAHFNPARSDRTIAAIKALPCFDEASRSIEASDIWSRRGDLERRRKHSDDWFFERFDMSW